MKIILIITACLGFVFGCQERAESLGSEKEILVFADSLQYEQLDELLSQAFEKEVATPWPEKIFELNYKPVAQLNEFTYKPRILIVGTLDGDNDASKRIQSILNSQQESKVKQGESYVFKNDDPWKKNQRLLILTAPEIETLAERIQNNREELFTLFHAPLVERVKKQMYSLYEQEDISEKLLQDYGWTVRVQHDYQIYKEFPEERFVMLRRIAPERWLFVAWRNADSPQITEAEAVEWRNEIGRRFYENDLVADQELESSYVEFAGRRALELAGLWENEGKQAGGPFKSWVFYDDVAEFMYMVDIAVYAPGLSKVSYLRQLEIMARTFRTHRDIASNSSDDS